jgi:endonuclease/exonuclease/phosphatase family metal-dependent hydrolase
MPYYKGTIDQLEAAGESATARDVANRLLQLRNRLNNPEVLPQRNVSKTILMATWNLREFGRNQKCGERLPESLLYIAEIFSHFDLAAVQELHQNLKDLQALMKLLGNWWEWIVTDVTPGKRGNQERIAFIYDARKVRFNHIAGKLVLPPKKKSVDQPARSPFLCSFRTGWRRISVCSVHIYYGTKNPNDPTRIAEINAVSKLLAARNRVRSETPDGEPENVVLIGDFNIFNKEGDKTSKALEKNDFIIPKQLRGLEGTNLSRDKHFDQIAFHDPKGLLRPTSRAGVFNYTEILYRDKEEAAHAQAMRRSARAQYRQAKDKARFYKEWRTFQISDHLPVWLELRVDFANNYLATVMRRKLSKKGTPQGSNARNRPIAERKRRKTARITHSGTA